MAASPSHGKRDDQHERKGSGIGKENQGLNQNVTIKDAERCAACTRPLATSSHIIDIGQNSTRWHPDCFKCAICHESMDKEKSCHLYKGQVICRNDFSRLKQDNTAHCARCRWPISATDWVHRAASHVYHIACFNCDICLRQLNTGEQFIVCPQHQPVSSEQPVEKTPVRLLCRQHFNVDDQNKHSHNGSGSLIDDQLVIEECRKSDSPIPDEHRPQQGLRKSLIDQRNQHQYSQLVTVSAVRGMSPGGSSTPVDQMDGPEQDNHQNELRFHEQQRGAAVSTSMTAGEAAINESQRLTVATSGARNLPSSSTSSSSSSTSSSLHAADYLSPMTPTNSSQTSSGLPCKSKRVRTTFTEDQLSILQTHFQIDSNPDGQDLERIATITGLSKRVTQVWFQNSRARQKKYLIKKKPIIGSAGITDSMAGYSMSATVNRQAFQTRELYGEFTQAGSVKEQMESARNDLTRGWCQAIANTLKRDDSVLSQTTHTESQIRMRHETELDDVISKDRDGDTSSSNGEENELCSKSIDGNSN